MSITFILDRRINSTNKKKEESNEQLVQYFFDIQNTIFKEPLKKSIFFDFSEEFIRIN